MPEVAKSVRTSGMNITGMQSPTGNLKPNMKASSSLLTHMKIELGQSVNINMYSGKPASIKKSFLTALKVVYNNALFR